MQLENRHKDQGKRIGRNRNKTMNIMTLNLQQMRQKHKMRKKQSPTNSAGKSEQLHAKK